MGRIQNVIAGGVIGISSFIGGVGVHKHIVDEAFRDGIYVEAKDVSSFESKVSQTDGARRPTLNSREIYRVDYGPYYLRDISTGKIVDEQSYLRRSKESSKGIFLQPVTAEHRLYLDAFNDFNPRDLPSMKNQDDATWSEFYTESKKIFGDETPVETWSRFVLPAGEYLVFERSFDNSYPYQPFFHLVDTLDTDGKDLAFESQFSGQEGWAGPVVREVIPAPNIDFVGEE